MRDPKSEPPRFPRTIASGIGAAKAFDQTDPPALNASHARARADTIPAGVSLSFNELARSLIGIILLNETLETQAAQIIAGAKP